MLTSEARYKVTRLAELSAMLDRAVKMGNWGRVAALAPLVANHGLDLQDLAEQIHRQGSHTRAR